MGFKYKLTREDMEDSEPGYLFIVRDFEEHTVISLYFFFSLFHLASFFLVWETPDSVSERMLLSYYLASRPATPIRK